jgi:hypothetical protein
MNLKDYIIEDLDLDWQDLLKSWSWRIQGGYTAWFLNCFGDLFCHQDGKVYRLALDDGSFQKLADSKDEFAKNDDEQFRDWLLTPLVDDLVDSGMTLAKGECYSFVRLPILGGDYSLENVVVRQVAFLYKALGPTFKELESIPDGEKVTFRVVDEGD